MTAAALALTLAGGLALGGQPPAQADTAYPPSATADYIAASFPDVGAGHVFDVVTIERLVKDVLGVDGQSIVLLGSPKNATTASALAHINDVAQSWGVEKIYFFDPNLAGAAGADLTDPSSGAPYANAATGIWATQLAQFSGSGADNLQGARLEYIDPAYTSADTYLFVYDRKAGGAAIVDSPATIVSDLRVDAPVSTASAIAALQADVAQVFADAGWSPGATTENAFDQFHFFTSAWTSAAPAVDTYANTAAKFKLQAVTAPELINILDTPGTHNIFVSGSWCPDSRGLVAYVAENAYRAGEPVYVFDFRVAGSIASGFSYTGTEAGGFT
ncbi:MAG: hypothetical protein LBQ92_01415, partial [Propionibacteriaceae bacterium]|nr:hypothetical protein [Propionibacteriaceae bacterium]